MQPEHDSQLQALFAKSAQEFRDEAFVTAATRRIESRERRLVIARGTLWVVGLAGLALISPFLTEGVSLLSDGLDLAFSSTNRVLYTPIGAGCAIVLSVTLLLLNRKRIWLK